METPNRHFNTYFGDPLRSWLTMAQNSVIKEDNLCDLVKRSGDYLKNELEYLSEKHPNFIGTPRGLGTFQAFDCQDVMTRDALIKRMKNLGVQCGPVGDAGIRLRPTLYFSEKHADVFVDRLDKACTDLA